MFFPNYWPEYINSIINGSFYIFQDIFGASSSYDCAKFTILGVSFENNKFFRGNLINNNIISLSSFLWSWGFKFGQNGSSDGSGNSSKFKFTHNSDNHEFIFIKEMKNNIRDWSTSHDNINVSIN